MLDKFKERLYFDFPNISDYKIYLAISGGKDSMALSQLLNQAEINHELLHCNFQLRGAESDGDEVFLKEYAENNALKIQVAKFDTYAEAEARKKSIQETARDLRYEWFDQFNSEKDLILMAHHLDDAIETFFINLLRGTGIKGIKGIPNYRHPFYRPLLNFTTDEILSFIDQNGIDYREDSSNAETKYLRNNIRHNVVPQLIDLESSFKKKMGAFFDEMHLLSDVLEKEKSRVNSAIFKAENTIDKSILTNTEPFLIQLALAPFGIRRSNLSDFLTFLNANSGARFITSEYEFLMNRDDILIKVLSQDTSFPVFTIKEIPFAITHNGISCTIDECRLDEFVKTSNPLFIDKKKINFPLQLRLWNHGDKIQPLGMSGSKLISDVLIDKKISLNDKLKTLILSDANDQIIAVPGIMISDLVKIDDNSISLFKISYSV